MIRWSRKPKFKKLQVYLDKASRLDPKRILEEYGKKGVSALAAATPIAGNKERYTITWYNSVMAGQTPLVLLLQYGHSTKSGYFLQGEDFINPALRPLYKSLARRLGQEIF